jgi:hypothetical protein
VRGKATVTHSAVHAHAPLANQLIPPLPTTHRAQVAAIIIGVAANLVHYYGFFSGAFIAMEDVEPLPTSELIAAADVACIAAALLSSLARFVFMGVISATTD